jgi:hypothetical protein
VSAEPPHPVFDASSSPNSTALSAVFRRLGAEAPAMPPPPVLPEFLGFTETVETASPPPAAAVTALAEPAETTDPVEIDVDEAAEMPEPAAPRQPRAEAVMPLGRIARPDEVWPLPRSVGPDRQIARSAIPPAAIPPAPAGWPARPPEPAPAALAPSPTPDMGRGGQGLSRNRRLHRRARLAADLEIDGVRCGLIDLSVGGFAAAGAPPFPPNTVVPVALRLTIDGIEVGTQLGARIIYASEARAGGRFIDLTASQTAFLRYVVTWRGESVGPVGATTLLDAISGGLDRAQLDPAAVDDELPAEAPRERWWVGLVGRKVRPPR